MSDLAVLAASAGSEIRGWLGRLYRAVMRWGAYRNSHVPSGSRPYIPTSATREIEDAAPPVEPRGTTLRGPVPIEQQKPRTQVHAPVQQGLAEVPPLPHVVRELLKELSDPASTARSVARIATSDPALAASLIRTVNSAAMGLRRKVTSTAEAVSYLGYSVVRSLVIRMRLEHVLPTRSAQAAYDAEDLWVHSLAVAYAADCLAQRVPEIDRGFVSTLGLLHDIGKLAINSYFPASAHQLKTTSPDFPDESFLDRERRVLGADHAEIGAILAEHWKLPTDLIEAIRCHHTPESAPVDLSPAIRHAVGVVHIANQLAKYCFVYSEDMEIDIVNDALFREIGLAGPVPRLLNGKTRAAISRAIFFADQSSTRFVGTTRRFVRLCEPDEAKRVLDLPRTRSKGDPQVRLADERCDDLFTQICLLCDCPPRRPGASPAWKGARRVRFNGRSSDTDAMVTEILGHQESLNLEGDIRPAARFLVRRLLPSLGDIGQADRIEVMQSVDDGRLTLAIRSEALSFARRFGPDVTARDARKVVEEELANVLNLRWFADIHASLDGATLLFVSHKSTK